MKDETIGWIAIIVMVASLIFLIFCTGGCQLLKPALGIGPKPPVPETPGEALITTVYKTRWIVTLGILGAAISFAALINGSKIAFGTLVGSLAAVVMDLMVIRYATWLALVGLVAAVGLLVWVIYVRRRAFVEVVNTVERLKPELGLEGALKVPLNLLPSNVRPSQSPATEKLVDKAQRALNKKGLK